MVGWSPGVFFVVLKLLPVLFQRIMERGKAPCRESTAGECFNAESLAVVMTVQFVFDLSWCRSCYYHSFLSSLPYFGHQTLHKVDVCMKKNNWDM